MIRLLCLLAFVCHGLALEQPAYRATHVVILVIDGPRYSETWGDPQHRYIPHIAGDLARQGVIYTNFRNEGETLTNPGHTALTTGVYQSIDNSGKELPRHPSMFQYYLSAPDASATDAWIVTSKDKLKVLADCTDPAWHGKFLPSADCGVNGSGPGYRADAETLSRAKSILGEHHPRLMLINLKEPDTSGHANNWNGYLDGIRAGDAATMELWNFIQADQELADRTALFVTNDHGRHLDGHQDGFVSHGDDCEGCRHIMLLALGPDFKRGEIIDNKRSQIDLAVTAASLVSVSLKDSPGQVMIELFAPVTVTPASVTPQP